MERCTKIGLRRALGALRRHIAAQFVTESAALGGILGICAGILVRITITGAHDWTPTVVSPPRGGPASRTRRRASSRPEYLTGVTPATAPPQRVAQ